MVKAMHGHTVVAGLGDTGLACARHLYAHGVDVALADTRSEPPRLAEASAALPAFEGRFGAFDPEWFAGATEIVLSPGLSPREPAVAAAVARGVPLLGEIELFARAVFALDVPVAAITGTNGKSTVSAWVADMAREAGREIALGGNFGPPALTLLGSEGTELFVLELSSFQLETTHSLRPRVAALLNVSADHLDRYEDLEDYRATKARIFRGADIAVLGRDDPWLAGLGERLARAGVRVLACTQEPPRTGEYGLVEEAGRTWLAHGDERRFALDELALPGRHNAANALAAMAIADALELNRDAIERSLRQFGGLVHRCELVRDADGVRWYDDSKGTNVGATVAAVEGFDAPLVLIAGGDGKGADFGPLAHALCDGPAQVREVVLLGRDAPAIRALIEGRVPVTDAPDMAAAVARAREVARPGDVVLLSPACASWDMFRDYRERGRVFKALVTGEAA